MEETVQRQRKRKPKKTAAVKVTQAARRKRWCCHLLVSTRQLRLNVGDIFDGNVFFCIACVEQLARVT